MPSYIFQAKGEISVQPNQPLPVKRFFLHLPGNPGQYTREQIVGYASSYHLGTDGVRYSIREISPNDPPVVVSEIHVPVLSVQNVQGGMPTGSPKPQPGKNRQDGPVDPQSHFQTLGDAALDNGAEAVYGSGDDGTWSDIVMGPFGGQEIPRP
jgi:hypothetical protein